MFLLKLKDSYPSMFLKICIRRELALYGWRPGQSSPPQNINIYIYLPFLFEWLLKSFYHRLHTQKLQWSELSLEAVLCGCTHLDQAHMYTLVSMSAVHWLLVASCKGIQDWVVMMDEGQQTSSNINKLLIWDRPKSPHWTTRSGLQRIVLHDAYEAKNNTMIS